MIVCQRLLQDIDNSRNNEVIMKNLLTVACIVTSLYACGGEFKHQDKISVDNSPPAEQGRMGQAAVERKGGDNKQAAETKTDSAIRMAVGLANSMF